jgi:hypothetical protein
MLLGSTRINNLDYVQTLQQIETTLSSYRHALSLAQSTTKRLPATPTAFPHSVTTTR